jgi:WD40 repeat protein
MHVLTAGKDARSVLSTLRVDSGELSVVRSFEEHRSTVTKCARFRPHLSGGEPKIFADCGNDMRVCVLDVRSSSAAPSIVIEGEASHGSVINSVAWHPTNENILASVPAADPAFSFTI